ncbi:MAG: hypothetical protein AAFQ17_00525 [Pseudomonadota bacterium]
MKRLVLAIIVVLLGTPAFADPPRYLIALWDGVDTGPGMWFTVDGASLAHDVSLAPVHRLPAGTTIRAEAGRLVISSALARVLGISPATPTLIEISHPRRDLSPSPAPIDRASELAGRQARIRRLLVDLQTEASAQARLPSEDASQ